MNVEDLRLGEDVNHHFIKGLMSGYNRYLQVRLEASEELEVSGGYAYIRGNHLEDKIAKENLLENISFDHAQAGAWNYLQFTVEQKNEKYLVIVRRSERIEETQKELKKKEAEKRDNNWLYGLSKINDSLGLDRFITGKNTEEINLFADNPMEEQAILKHTQLELNLKESYDGFYILTYEINPATFMIDDASLWMMDSQTIELVQIESLRSLVVKYGTLIDADLLMNVQEEFYPEEIITPADEYTTHRTERPAASPSDYVTEESRQDEEIQDNE